MQVSITVTDDDGSSRTTVIFPSSQGTLRKADLPTLQKVIFQNEQLSNAIIDHITSTIDSECSALSRRSIPSRFRKVCVPQMVDFRWSTFAEDLAMKAPTLDHILSSVISHSDARNKSKVDTAHIPGKCMMAAVLLKERNREMCGLQSVISLLLYYSHAEKPVYFIITIVKLCFTKIFHSTQIYSRLNQVGVCVSYTKTLSLVDDISQHRAKPLSDWINRNIPFKFWGDNVDKKRSVRDVRHDHQGELVHMYSILAGSSRTADSATLSRAGQIADLSTISSSSLLPTEADIDSIKQNLIVLVGRVLTNYIEGLKPLSKAVPNHITHKFSKEMAGKSSVVLVDVLFKNEACRSDMIDIMSSMIGYLGSEYPDDHRLLSGEDQLTCERQVGSRHHVMNGDTRQERLELLEPVTEDWHCLVCFLSVSPSAYIFYILFVIMHDLL